MSRLGKILFLFSGLSLLTLAVGRYILGDWIPFFWILLALCAGFMVGAVAVDRRFFVDFFSMKTTKHGMNMGVMILLVMALIFLLNYIGVKNNKTWDFSQAGRNSLSDQSLQVLKSLKEDIRISYFYKKGVEANEENRRAFRELLKKYQDVSDKIKLDFYEVNENRAKAEEFGVTKGSGVVFLEYKGQRNRVEKIDEQEMTSALIKVTREKKRTVYFSVGHQEFDLDDAKETRGLNLFKLMVENNSFVVKTLNLATTPQVPEDADVVAIIGPQQNFSDYEIKALEDFLKKGGHMMLALEPKKSGGLERILSQVGVEPQNNYIVSTYKNVGFIEGPAIGSVFSQNYNPTKVFFGKQEVVRFDWPMDLKLNTPPSGVTHEAFVKTSSEAEAMKTPQLTEARGLKGPFNLAVSVKGRFPGSSGDKAKDFSLAVFGDAEFMSNYLLYQNLNRDLALNTISDLAGEESLISIAPREVEKTEIQMTSVKSSMFLFGIILPIPILMMATSIGLWMRRRSA